jgi:hypothetical protein
MEAIIPPNRTGGTGLWAAGAISSCSDVHVSNLHNVLIRLFLSHGGKKEDIKEKEKEKEKVKEKEGGKVHFVSPWTDSHPRCPRPTCDLLLFPFLFFFFFSSSSSFSLALITDPVRPPKVTM